MAPKKLIFHVVLNNDMDDSMSITAVDDFPDELGEYRESIFAQMNGKDYYKSQLVLMQGEDFITYDFYSDRAWIDAVKQQAVKPYQERDREATRVLEREQWKQEGVRELREARGSEFSHVYHIVDSETGQPIYVGQAIEVDRRMQQHYNQSQALSGQPKLYGYLNQIITDGRAYPTTRVVSRVPRMDVNRAEQAEIFRLIREGVVLFNKEYMRGTTRARAMTAVEIPIEWLVKA